MAGGEDGCPRPTASFPRFKDQLGAIAETARRAGVFIDPVKHDWNPYIMVRAHGGPWLISPWSSGSSHGWCAQQMVEVEEAWLRVPDTRGWVGTGDLEPDLIVAKLLEAVELPKDPSGHRTVSTKRVPNHQILARLAWLRSFGLPNAKLQRDEGSPLAVAWLSASLSSLVATFGKELGAKASAATAKAAIEGGRRLSNYRRAHLQLNHDDLSVHDHSHHLLVVSQAETDPLPNEAWQQVRLHFHDGEGMLDWDTAASRWRPSIQGRRRAVADVPQLQVHLPHAQSSRCHTQAAAADAPNRSPCAARTGSPATPAGRPTTAQETDNAARAPATTAPPPPTTRRQPPTASPRSAARSHAEIDSRFVFTVEQRDGLREELLRIAGEDERVVAGAAVGSLAVDGGDRYSDLDLTFGIADHVPVADVLNDWTHTLIDELDAVHLADLERGLTTYRVFLLPDGLQFDLSMTPAAQFRPAGPRFRLLFGETAAGDAEAPNPPAAGDLFIPTPPAAGDLFGWGVIYALHARACIERGRVWQAEHYVGAVRDHALSLACLRQGLPAVQARGYDDLSADTLARFAGAHVGAVEPDALRRALAASVRTLMRAGTEARLPHADTVAQRLDELR